jgi:hypothetical protein
MQKHGGLSRRELLGAGVAWPYGALAVSRAAAAQSCGKTPPQTTGPSYPVYVQIDKDVDLSRLVGHPIARRSCSLPSGRVPAPRHRSCSTSRSRWAEAGCSQTPPGLHHDRPRRAAAALDTGAVRRRNAATPQDGTLISCRFGSGRLLA